MEYNEFQLPFIVVESLNTNWRKITDEHSVETIKRKFYLILTVSSNFKIELTKQVVDIHYKFVNSIYHRNMYNCDTIVVNSSKFRKMTVRNSFFLDKYVFCET